jgi:hypothetical protein
MDLDSGATEFWRRMNWEQALRHWRGIRARWVRLTDPHAPVHPAPVRPLEQQQGLLSDEASQLVDDLSRDYPRR